MCKSNYLSPYPLSVPPIRWAWIARGGISPSANHTKRNARAFKSAMLTEEHCFLSYMFINESIRNTGDRPTKQNQAKPRSCIVSHFCSHTRNLDNQETTNSPREERPNTIKQGPIDHATERLCDRSIERSTKRSASSMMKA